MNDRDLMENLLTVVKGSCDLFMHGTTESSSPEVHETFNEGLSNALDVQEATYQTMLQYGWYQATKVAPEKINQTASKFNC